MTTEPSPRQIGRSILAILAGFLATAVLSVSADLILHAIGVFPPWGQPMSDGLFVIATLYRIIFTVLGGYLTARLAPNEPMMHALILGIIGFVLAIPGAAATWGKGPEFG